MPLENLLKFKETVIEAKSRVVTQITTKFDQLLNEIRDKSQTEPSSENGQVNDLAGNPEKQPIDIDVTDPNVLRAVIKIQASFKRFKARKAEREKLLASSQTATQAPRADFQAVDIDLNDPEVESAAVKIQAGFKGFQGRKQVSDMRRDAADGIL